MVYAAACGLRSPMKLLATEAGVFSKGSTRGGCTSRLPHMSVGRIAFLANRWNEDLRTSLAIGQRPSQIHATWASPGSRSQHGNWLPQNERARETSKTFVPCLLGLTVLYCQVSRVSKNIVHILCPVWGYLKHGVYVVLVTPS